MQQAFPQSDESKVDEAAVKEMEWVKQFILGIRKVRSGMDIAPSKALPVLLQDMSAEDQLFLSNNELFLQKLAKLESIQQIGDDAPESATTLVGSMKVLIPLAGLIDKDAELARLDKEIGKLEKTLKSVEGKLSNPNFVDKAPADVVEKEKAKADEMHHSLNSLQEQRERIASI